MRAILFNPVLNIISVVEINTDNGIEDYYHELQCDCFTVVDVSDDMTIYLDDEGLLKSGNIVSEITVDGESIKLAGNLLFLGGVDDEGETLGLDEKYTPISIMNMINQDETWVVR